MKIHQNTKSLKSFQDMPLAPSLLTALEKMKITRPTPIQSQVLPVGLAGGDLIAVAQTGSGKTLAFALPLLTALSQKPSARALVLAPSREMAQQIYKVFEALSFDLPISCTLVIGGLSSAQQTSDLKKNPKLIVATPGRMNDHLLKNKLLLQHVEMVIIDEADRMLDMGFAPQLKSIKATLRGSWQTLMFSASFSPAVETVASLFMKPDVIMIRSERAEAPVGSLKQRVLLIDRKDKHDRLLDELNATQGGVIVFTSDREGCEKLGRYLKEYGYSTDLIHGELSHGHRNRVIRELRSGEIRIVVATDLLARGLDIPHVDHVINFELPAAAEDFLHRIGRTARAGRKGEALTFVTPGDERTYKKIQPYLQGAEEVRVNPNFKFVERRRTDKFSRPGKSVAVKTRPKSPSGKGHPPRRKASEHRRAGSAFK